MKIVWNDTCEVFLVVLHGWRCTSLPAKSLLWYVLHNNNTNFTITAVHNSFYIWVCIGLWGPPTLKKALTNQHGPWHLAHCELAGLSCIGGWVTVNQLVFVCQLMMVLLLGDLLLLSWCKRSCNWLACWRSACLYTVTSSARFNGCWSYHGLRWLASVCFTVGGFHGLYNLAMFHFCILLTKV